MYRDFTSQDKSEWGRGPWSEEPDTRQFEYKGYECWINRGPLGALCGYVAIPLTSPFALEEKYESVVVHGGITFSEQITNRDTGKEMFCLGFDCAHYGDMTPKTNTMLRRIQDASISNLFHNPFRNNDVYRDIAFVENEIKKLVDQIDNVIDIEEEKRLLLEKK